MGFKELKIDIKLTQLEFILNLEDQQFYVRFGVKKDRYTKYKRS